MTRDEASSASGTPLETHVGRSWFEIGLVFLVFFVAGGAPAPGVNEAHYLCRLKHYWDPAYCPGDLFLESPDAHFTVVWLFGWVTQFISLEATAWLGRLLSWALLAFSWQRLVGRLTRTPYLGVLGAALLVVGTRELNFAGEWIIGGFEAKTIAYGVVMLAIVEAIDSRWNRCWILLGIASAFHALVGGWSVVALGLAAAWRRDLPPLRGMWPGLLSGAILALAGVVPALQLNQGTPPEVVAEANVTYVYFRLPHHLALLNQPTNWIFERAGRHLIAVFGLAGLLMGWRRHASRPLLLVVAFAWASEAISLLGLGVSLVGWNHPEWAASLLRYYWHRLADIATPIGAILIALHWLDACLVARRKKAVLIAFVVMVGCSIYFAGLIAPRLAGEFPRGDGQMADPAAWIEMCEWIETNTPRQALFLVPRASQTFKWRASRAEVATRKDIPQDAASMVEWRRRLEDVYRGGTRSDGSTWKTRSLARLGAARLRELGREYGADYVLDQAPRRSLSRPQQKRSSLPIVHRVGAYTLYRLAP